MYAGISHDPKTVCVKHFAALRQLILEIRFACACRWIDMHLAVVVEFEIRLQDVHRLGAVYRVEHTFYRALIPGMEQTRVHGSRLQAFLEAVRNGSGNIAFVGLAFDVMRIDGFCRRFTFEQDVRLERDIIGRQRRAYRTFSVDRLRFVEIIDLSDRPQLTFGYMDISGFRAIQFGKCEHGFNCLVHVPQTLDIQFAVDVPFVIVLERLQGTFAFVELSAWAERDSPLFERASFLQPYVGELHTSVYIVEKWVVIPSKNIIEGCLYDFLHGKTQ